MTQEKEQWLPVVGYEGLYKVSDRGNVRSLRRKVIDSQGRTHVYPARKKKCQLARKGYLKVSLCRDGKQKNCYVHLLVAAAFIGPCPDGYVVDHIDKDSGNPRLANLQHMTRGESDAQGGKGSRGEGNSHSKLTEATVLEIRKDSRPPRETAEEHGISTDHVRRIQSRKYWGWLPDAEAVGE